VGADPLPAAGAGLAPVERFGAGTFPAPLRGHSFPLVRIKAVSVKPPASVIQLPSASSAVVIQASSPVLTGRSPRARLRERISCGGPKVDRRSFALRFCAESEGVMLAGVRSAKPLYAGSTPARASIPSLRFADSLAGGRRLPLSASPQAAPMRPIGNPASRTAPVSHSRFWLWNPDFSPTPFRCFVGCQLGARL